MWDCEHCGTKNIITELFCPTCFTPRTPAEDVPAEETKPEEPAKEDQPPAAPSKSNWGK